MKTLIVYYSFTHNNEMLAKLLQQKLRCDAVKIEEMKKRTGFTIFMDLIFRRYPTVKTADTTLQDYEHVILIAPIWAGQVASPLKTFLSGEKEKIKSYSFITVCGGEGQKNKISRQLFAMLRKDPLVVTELPVSDLLAADKKNKVASASRYRVTEKDLTLFQSRINYFLTRNGMPLARDQRVKVY